MSDVTNLPRQSYFRATLQSPITAVQTSGIILSEQLQAISGTIYLNLLDPNNVETISCTGQSGTGELTGVTRAVATYSGETATAYAHGAGITIVLSDDWNYWQAIVTGLNDKVDIGGDTMTGLLQFSGTTNPGIKMNSLTTAQRDALSAANGEVIYNTTTSELNVYQGGAWVAIASGSTQPNGSTTVAGKYQTATVAQQLAATATGSTGAQLVPVTANMVTTSAGAGDAGKIAVLNASGVLEATAVNATATPTASKIPIADGGGKLADGWLNNPLPSAPTANDITYYSGSWLSAGVQTFIGSILNRAYIPNFSNFTETTTGGGTTNADKDTVIPFVLSTYNGGGTSAVLSMGGADGSKAFEINSVAKVTNTTAAANRGVALAGIADQISTFTAVADPAGYGGSTEVCWFQYENGTLSTVTKVAGVAVESNTIGAITVTNYNRYRIVWNETDVKFYVNGTLVATHTVRLPNANMDVIGVSARDASSSATTGIRADFASFTYIQDHT